MDGAISDAKDYVQGQLGLSLKDPLGQLSAFSKALTTNEYLQYQRRIIAITKFLDHVKDTGYGFMYIDEAHKQQLCEGASVFYLQTNPLVYISGKVTGIWSDGTVEVGADFNGDFKSMRVNPDQKSSHLWAIVDTCL